MEMVIDQALIIKNKIKRIFIIGDGPFLDNFKLAAQNFLKKVYLLRPNKYINQLKFKSDDLIFSINKLVYNTFKKAGLDPLFIIKADPNKLVDQSTNWGSYYDTVPCVYAVRIPS